ncbi:MAG: DUF2062 domain-containing protein [Acidobacteriota bacterium]
MNDMTPVAAGPRDDWWVRRVRRPLVALLQAGTTPEKLALSLALGLVLGVFPVVGATTILCAIVALATGLNLVAMQIVNYLAYPVHLALLLPFVRLGERIVGAEPVPLSLAALRASMRADFWGTASGLWRTEVHAITAWSVAAPFLVGGAYLVFLPLLRKLAARRARLSAATQSVL